MRGSRSLVLGLLAACAVTLPIAGCGGGGSTTTTTTTTESTSSQPASTTPSAADVALAKKALPAYQRAIGAYNAGLSTYLQSEHADAATGSVLGVRNDAYDFRNVVYDYDKAIRKVHFPASVQPDVNTLLEANGKQIGQLDKISQSTTIGEINGYLSRALTALSDPSLKVTNDLEKLLGKPISKPAPSTSAPSPSEVASAIAKTGLVSPKDVKCAAQQVLKNLGTGQPFDVTDAGMQTLLGGGSLDKTLQTRITAAGQYCGLGLG
jgi:guanyl-specific ribonuclease Sa